VKLKNNGEDLRKPQEKTRRKKKGCSFSTAQQGVQKTSEERTTAMPRIDKAAIVTLEMKIEEPTKQRLEDYARFIDTTPDQVCNSGKNLWRDPDDRKGTDQRRAPSQRSPKSAASPLG
jgi:hypothetical protein